METVASRLGIPMDKVCVMKLTYFLRPFVWFFVFCMVARLFCENATMSLVA